MAVNSYFSWNDLQNRNEQSLVENILAETIQIFGQNVIYAPRTLNAKDPLLGEDPLSSFDKYYTIEMYLQNVDGYEGDESIISRLSGYRMPVGATLLCSKMRFQNVITEQGAYAVESQQPQIQEVRPLEGDLIYLPMDKTLWQITSVSSQRPFYMMGEVTIWTISVKKYSYSSETLDTGFEGIDHIAAKYGQVQSNPSDLVNNDPLADNQEVQTDSSSLINRTIIDPFSGGNL